MRKVALLSLIAVVLCVSGATKAGATNGDNLIGIGPVARAMGGVGIAAPQDAISAVFANPAAMCFGPYCPSSEVDFAGTAFMPHVKASVEAGGESFSAKSDEKVYPIPAFGLSVPISMASPHWRFGVAAYGVTGLGVDYRGTEIEQQSFPGTGGMAPLIQGAYTQYQIMKFAPSVAVQPLERLSLGAALHIDYGNLDLQNGSASGYGVGVQVGAIYKVTDDISLGLNFVSPQPIDHENVLRLQNGSYADLKMESPTQVGLGVAWTGLGNKLLLEADLKWFNWSGADGYEDFDWRDQWVIALGAQYRPIPKLALRAGYNYGQNPVKEHNNWSSTSTVDVQGTRFPAYYYESFRVVGFPAVVEHHVTLGAGYEFTPRFSMNVAYMHAFENTITEKGAAFYPMPGETKLQSSLSEDSLDLGLTWRF